MAIKPKTGKVQTGKEWFLRGLDMAVMPFTDPKKAWVGFRKEVLNMKGGFAILLVLVTAFSVHYLDSYSTVAHSTSTFISTSNNTNALAVLVNDSSNVTSKINSENPVFNVSANSGNVAFQVGGTNNTIRQSIINPLEKPFIALNSCQILNESKTTDDGNVVFETVFVFDIANPKEGMNIVCDKFQGLISASVFVAGHSSIPVGVKRYECAMLRVTYLTSKKVKESDFGVFSIAEK